MRARIASMATVDRLGTSTEAGPQWRTGLAAGIQAALLSVLTVVVPTVAVFVATASDPTNADVSWWSSVHFGAALWVLGHGGRVMTESATVTLVPLGIALLSGYFAYVTGRRSGCATTSAVGVGTVVYTGVVLGVGVAVGTTDGVGLLRATVGGAIVSGGGLLLAMRRNDSTALAELRILQRIPGWLRAGVAGAVGSFAVTIVLAAGLATFWIVSGATTIGQIVIGLGANSLSGVGLAVAETAYVPNFLAWALAFLAGPGFAVGVATSFAPTGIVSGPLPAVPLLGALPRPPVDEAWTHLPWVLVLAGLLGGWILLRWLRQPVMWQVFAAGGIAALGVGLLAAGLTMIASGGIATGRMSQFGADPLAVGVQVLLYVGAGIGVVVLIAAIRMRIRSGTEPTEPDMTSPEEASAGDEPDDEPLAGDEPDDETMAGDEPDDEPDDETPEYDELDPETLDEAPEDSETVNGVT
jgi:hypothetical protein